MKIHLAIVTPVQNILDVECDEVVAPGVRGELCIMPGHVPIITTLEPGVLTVVRDGRKQFHAVSTGYAEVEGDRVTMLTGSCEEQSTIDVERAKKAHLDDEIHLSKLGSEDGSYAEQRMRASRARARLDAVERR